MTSPPTSQGPNKGIFVPLHEIEATLAQLPLFKDLPSTAYRDIARYITPFEFFEDTIVFTPDRHTETLNYLFIVVRGTLLQFGTAPDGFPWLPRELKRGDVFGRYSLLFYRPPDTTVRGVEAGLLYGIDATYMSLILARWPDLWEKLIPEKRILRLRGIPLYSSLTDDHIRRLADHIKEKHLAPNETHVRNVGEEPHVWVVAEGQIVHVRPDAGEVPLFERAKPEMLASVGFVFADEEIRDPDIQETNQIPARSVRAVSQTVLYGLPQTKFLQLLDPNRIEGTTIRGNLPLPRREMLKFVHFPDVDILLRKIPLFDVFPDDWCRVMRGFVAWIFTPSGQTVIRQGQAGRALYILEDGEGLVRAVDDRGRRRPRSFLFPDGYVGRKALLQGTEHDVSVEATKPSYWIRISREDLDRFGVYMERRERPRGLLVTVQQAIATTLGPLQAMLQGRPFRPCEHRWCTVWERLGGLSLEEEERYKKPEKHTWLEPDEKILWLDRAHPIVFFTRTGPFILALAILLSLFITFLPTGVSRGILFSTIVLVVAGLVYEIVDYFNDFYALTDRRVVHRERVLLLREDWQEIPLPRIQDIIVRQSWRGKLLGYGTLIIQSAAAGGNIEMKRIPSPQAVQHRILDERGRARSRAEAWRRELLREDMIKRLFEGILASWPDIATGTQHPLDRKTPSAGEEETSEQPSRIGRLVRALGFSRKERAHMAMPWAPISHWRVKDTLYWRKHWLNLLQRVTMPLFLLLILLSGFGLIWTGIPGMGYVIPRHLGVFFAWAVAFMGALGWFIWQYDDWRNDMYILSPERLIDIEKKPFFFQEERRQAPLGQVQTVQLQMRGIVSQLLNYGDVVIKTAAAEGDLTFEFIPNPREAVREIQRALEDFRRKQEQREYERQQGMMAEGLEIYHELRRRYPGMRRWEHRE